ncbi:hypothetical protein NDU88_001415 [Pleurodeles waltl]|uniref:Uncharacterized protein n=1 Tax=Pleurodeles waltl TaxID=8319 RepID=A0AAV7VWE6_PLEWA|nr:hypothetical protein NDU88_001415 [Pleurodeles waltl]
MDLPRAREGVFKSGRNSSLHRSHRPRSRLRVAGPIQAGCSVSTRPHRRAGPPHPFLCIFMFSFPLGEAKGPPAPRDRSGGAGVPSPQTWVSFFSLSVTAPQRSPHSDAPAILDLGNRGEHTQISPRLPVRFSWCRPHFGQAVPRCWGCVSLSFLGLFDARIWLGPSPGALR